MNHLLSSTEENSCQLKSTQFFTIFNEDNMPMRAYDSILYQYLLSYFGCLENNGLNRLLCKRLSIHRLDVPFNDISLGTSYQSFEKMMAMSRGRDFYNFPYDSHIWSLTSQMKFNSKANFEDFHRLFQQQHLKLKFINFSNRDGLIFTFGLQDRSFGVTEIQMIGCQACILLGMIEYVFILLKPKNLHDVDCKFNDKNKMDVRF